MTSNDESKCHKCGVLVNMYEGDPHACSKNNIIPITPARVPDERHYALLVFENTVPATPTYVAYADKDVWLREIKNLEEVGKPYSALRVIPVKVKRIVEIEVYDDRGKRLSPKKEEVADD